MADLSEAIRKKIDDRIAVYSSLTALQINAGGYKKIFSTQIHTPAPGIYIRNTNCWAYGLDLTCISPWNSFGGVTRAGTLISPRHLVWAQHYSIPNGTTIRFVTLSNEVVTRTILASQEIVGLGPYGLYSDLRVGVLDLDVTDCTFAKILPSDWADYIPNNGQRLPALKLDQEEKALVGDIGQIFNPSDAPMEIPSSGFWEPIDATRLKFYEELIVGDSGNPGLMVIDNQLVILTTWLGASSGPAIIAYKTEIETAMAALSIAAGLSPGEGDTPYTLTEIDLSSIAERAAELEAARLTPKASGRGLRIRSSP